MWLLAPLARLISYRRGNRRTTRPLRSRRVPRRSCGAGRRHGTRRDPDADIISITVLSWPDARTAACTHERALELDHQQYASGRGPCLEAAWHRAPLRAIIGEERERWPEFVEAAQQYGIRASLSVPLLIAVVDSERELVGSLNIYSHTASAFDQFDAELMRLYTVAAGQAITNAGRWQNSRDCHPARGCARLAFRHRHGQRRSNRTARMHSK